jgi:hypothetical protein
MSLLETSIFIVMVAIVIVRLILIRRLEPVLAR